MSAPDQTVDLRGARVLVVDDDADNREMLASVLTHSGALVATAESAAEALSVFERERPHVLISDIGLPDEDGCALLRKLRALPIASSVPAIALSGYGDPEDCAEASLAGFQAHLTKPVELPIVLATVARMLGSRPGDP
jgi:CheY-like chemotaxis protein